MRVTATNNFGDVSALDELRPPSPQAVPPDPPTNLTATRIGSSEIRLARNAPLENCGANITGCRIEVSGDVRTGWTVPVGNTNAADDLTYVHTGPHGGTTLHYRVSAINTADPRRPLTNANATTEASPPAPPRNLRAVRGDGGDLITRYVQRYPKATWPRDPTGWTLVGLAVLASGPYLINGQEYRFAVRAVNSRSEGEDASAGAMVGGRRDRVAGAGWCASDAWLQARRSMRSPCGSLAAAPRMFRSAGKRSQVQWLRIQSTVRAPPGSDFEPAPVRGG